MTRVDVVVPTHNNPELLATCLNCLRNSSFGDYRLIVVDDASTPAALGVVESAHPGATVLRSPVNRGLVRAFNAGIRAGTSEYVALLNDDTEVTSDWLGALVEVGDAYPNAGSVASKIRLTSDRRKFHSAGDTFSVRGIAGNRGVWLDDLGQYDTLEEVFGACGGAALYRRAALEAVQLPNGDVFDRRLFMYLEDVDMAWRLRHAGYTAMYAPDALVYHHLSATGGGSLASYYVNRNRWLLLAYTVPPAIWRKHRLRILATQAGILAGHLCHLSEPAARAAIRGYVSGFARWLVDSQRNQIDSTASIESVERLLVE